MVEYLKLYFAFPCVHLTACNCASMFDKTVFEFR